MSATTYQDRDAERSRRRRLAAREHHPDLGGDPERLVAALQAIDEEFGRYVDGHAVTVVRPTPRWRRTVRTVRRAGRTVRARVPRHWPLGRRFIDL